MAKQPIGPELALKTNALLEVERNLAKGPRSKRLRQHLSEVCHDWMEEQVKVCTLG